MVLYLFNKMKTFRNCHESFRASDGLFRNIISWKFFYPSPTLLTHSYQNGIILMSFSRIFNGAGYWRLHPFVVRITRVSHAKCKPLEKTTFYHVDPRHNRPNGNFVCQDRNLLPKWNRIMNVWSSLDMFESFL